MNAMQNFLELIWLLHVIVCAVFLGFKTENPSWLVITRKNVMQNFLELIWLLHVIVCAVFLSFKTKIQVGLLLLE